MTRDELKNYFANAQPAAVFEETGEWLNVQIEAAQWRSLAEAIHTNFDYLFCLTCIDWKTHFTMVYHLTSTVHRQPVVIKAKTDRAQPIVGSVCDLWRTAEFHEREVYDLFGVQFTGHPDLRRLILTDDFVGYPLRKDFEDPVNMIKL